MNVTHAYHPVRSLWEGHGDGNPEPSHTLSVIIPACVLL